MMVNVRAPVVLVIDADSTSRDYLDVMLRRNGYTVLSAASGKEGLIAAWKDLPDVILVDPSLPDMSGTELIGKFRQDRRTVSQPCIAIGVQEEQGKIASYIAAGFNEYMIKSKETVRDLLTLLPRFLSQSSTSQKSGMLLVFLSAKGGTGTSSLCANIGMCTSVANPLAKVVVVDMVLPIGSIANIVGYSGSMNIVSVAAQPVEGITAAYLEKELPRIASWKFFLLAGSPDPESANRLGVSRVPQVFSALQEKNEYIFVDLGCSLSRISMPIIRCADVVSLVISSDLSSVTLTRVVWKYLQEQNLDARRLYLIQNRPVGLEGMTRSEAEKAIGLEIQMTMPYMGGNLTLANNRNEPVARKFPNDSATLMLQQASRQMVELGNRLRSR